MNALMSEKRVLELQILQMKNQKPLTRNYGVGDFSVDEPIVPSPLKRGAVRDIGIGDGDVFAVEATMADYGPVRIHEREVSTDQNTEVKEKEIKTVFLGGGRTADTALDLMSGYRQMKPATRTIGVGEDKVCDDFSVNYSL